jgi:23S rRNA (uracil1939-C5)-methyltransferase
MSDVLQPEPNASRPGPLVAGMLIDLTTTDDISRQGEAIARHDGCIVFVQGAAPAEIVRARISKVSKSHARAELVEVLRPSAVRRQPLCPHFGDCGGCQLQHVQYSVQVAAKQKLVHETLARVGGIDWPHAIPVHTESEWGWRGRARLQIGKAEHGSRIGFFRRGSHAICDVTTCPILVPELANALTTVRQGLVAWRRPEQVEIAAVPGMAASDPPMPGLAAAQLMTEICGHSYAFSPQSFFQGNVHLVGKLCRSVTEGQSGGLALDLFAGVGLFSAQLCKSFREVVAVEASPKAADLARRNLASFRGARIVTERVEDWLGGHAARVAREPGRRPDLTVIDPPRGGAPDAMGHLAKVASREVIYVSCDPATLARDLRSLRDDGYLLDRLEAFDLFPQTMHVETVAWLRHPAP